MADLRRVLCGAAAIGWVLTLADCGAPPPQVPVPAPQLPAPAPPAAPPVAAAPQTDQPPIAAPTSRIAVSPLGPAGAAEPEDPPPETAPAAVPPAPDASPAAPETVPSPAPETVAPATIPDAVQGAALTPPQPPPAQPASTPAAEPPDVVLAAIPTPVPVPEIRPEPDPAFSAFLSSFRVEALQAGISAETYDRAMSGISVDPRVNQALVTQPEFVRPIWDYLAGAISDVRVSGGRERLAAEPALFDRLEATYGVPREVLTAVWGMESAYGRILGGFNIFEALATLAYDGRRQDFGRRELLAALKIAQAEGLDPKQMNSSWAGAFGQTQFIPTTFLEIAVDGDGDGVRNLWNSHADALASAASYLRRSGWRAGQGWGEEIRLPENFPYDQADPEIRKPQSEWVALGVRTATGQDLPATDDEVAIFLPAGARGPAFLVGANFNAILRYNNATPYALAVGLLSDRFKGEEGVLGAWPRDERPLNREQRIALQEGLAALGFPTGNADGVLGRGTRLALRDYQKSRGVPADGFASIAMLNRINAERNR